jgi:hypothetical protein
MNQQLFLQLNEVQKPYIAQAISRLYIKMKKYGDAEEWVSRCQT